MLKQTENDDNPWLSYGSRILLSTVAHPVEYGKVLIQLGYEPIPPRPTTTLFGKPALKYPNIFEYIRYIKSRDGFIGCYRGLVPKLCGNIVGALTSQKIIENLEQDEEEIDENEELDDETRRVVFIRNVKKEVTSRVAAIIVTQPFNVIAIRMMGRFLGLETNYTGVFGTICEIYKEDGVLGFFSGLVPRLLGDVISLLIANTVTYVVCKYLFEDRMYHFYISTSASLLASTIAYPFQVVSNCMVVTGSGLAIGNPPNMPIYNSWLHCWTDLSKKNELKRGTSILIRYYTGPKMIINGRAVPIQKDQLLKLH